MTDCQSVSPSWCRTPCGAHDQILIIITVLSLSGAPSDPAPGYSEPGVAATPADLH
jgi:hypothetical protein